MTIEINRPELEALIQQRLESGQFGTVEDILWRALNPAPDQDIGGMAFAAPISETE